MTSDDQRPRIHVDLVVHPAHVSGRRNGDLRNHGAWMFRRPRRTPDTCYNDAFVDADTGTIIELGTTTTAILRPVCPEFWHDTQVGDVLTLEQPGHKPKGLATATVRSIEPARTP